MFIPKNTKIVVPYFVDNNYCYGTEDGIPWKTSEYTDQFPENERLRLENSKKWDYIMLRQAVAQADHFVVKKSYVKEMKSTFFKYSEICRGDVHTISHDEWMKFKMDVFCGVIGGNVLLFCDPDMALELSEVFPIEVVVHRLPEVLSMSEKGFMNLDAITGAGKLLSVTETYTGCCYERYFLGESWSR